MGRKADARRAKQLKKAEQFEQAKAKSLAAVKIAEVPRVAQLPSEERMRLTIGVDRSKLQVPPQPRALADGSRFAAQVTWCMRRRDVQGKWTWGEDRAWTEEEWRDIIEPAFLEYERLTWGEIDQRASGTGHKMHHFQELHTLVTEAQERWFDLGLEEFDTLFRFRLGGTRRFWGYILQAHFFGVWWDRAHGIYPV